MNARDPHPRSPRPQDDSAASQGVLRILSNVARSVLRRKLAPPGFAWPPPQPSIAANGRQVRTGMSEDRAIQTLGAPDGTYPFGPSNQSLTLWVYDQRDEPVYLWLDEAGRVKMTCRTSIGYPS